MRRCTEAIALIESIKGEPPVRPMKGTCATCRYACRFAGMPGGRPAGLAATQRAGRRLAAYRTISITNLECYRG